MATDRPGGEGEALDELAARQDWRITRRTFLKGAAAATGAVAAADLLGGEFLGGLKPADAAQAPVVEQLVRTGHSNNCDGACGHLVHVADGKVRLVEGAFWEPTTIDGRSMPFDYPARICLRGVSQQENLYSVNRIKYPYKRVGERGSGKWQRISWDEAATLVADGFKKAQAAAGKDSVWIAPYTGSLSILEGVVGVGFRFASVIGACAGDFEGDNEGDSSTPCGWNYVLADPAATAGGIFDGHESTDFLNSKLIVLWGNNVAETSIPDWRVVLDARAKGATVVAIDPRFTSTSAGSDMWLPIRPGTDVALIDGIINHVIQTKAYDEAYLKKYTVAPFLVDSKTGKWLRSSAVPGLSGKDDYVVLDAGNKLKRASDAKDPQLTTLGMSGPPGSQPPTAFQLLADAMSKYTPDYVATHHRPYAGADHRHQRAVGGEPSGRRAGRLRPLALVPRRPDDAGAAHAAGADRQHRRARRRRDHLRRRSHQHGLRPARLVGAAGHHDVLGAGADAVLRRRHERQAAPGEGGLVHGRQLRPADVGPQQDDQGAQGARLPGRLRLRHVGHRRPGRRGPALLHLPGEDRPALAPTTSTCSTCPRSSSRCGSPSRTSTR